MIIEGDWRVLRRYVLDIIRCLGLAEINGGGEVDSLIEEFG